MTVSIDRRAFAIGATALAAGLAVGCTPASDEPETPADAEAGPQAEPGAAGALFANPGTYTGTGLGRNGDVNVTLTASENAIEDITHDSVETITIGIEAMNKMAERILATQSTAVDMISGATFSSAAFVAALADAVEQAGGDAAVLKKAVEPEPVDYVTEADIVIVGAGGAGLTAARRAAEDGVSIILLEKSGIVGGNTSCTVMGPNAAGSKTQEAIGSTYTVEKMLADQSEDPLARPDLVAAMVVNSGEMIDWFAESCGSEFELNEWNEGVVSFKNYYTDLEGHDAPGTGVIAVDTCHTQLKEYPDVHIYTDIAAESLVTDGGTVTGVVATDNQGNTVTFTGKAVILAAGGYSFNHDIIDAANPGLATVGSDQVAPVTGDAILMAQDLGAQVVDLGEMENSGYICTVMKVAQYMGEADCGWNPDVHRGIPRGFFANLEGERFISETNFTREDILGQTDGTIFHIFPANDETVRDGVARFIELGIVHRASSPEELASALGMDADAFAATLDEWNASASEGRDAKFGRDDEGVVEIDPADLCGYLFKNTIHYCMGGILIDADTHVLDESGAVIPGLYAAGETTGGVHGGTRRDGSGITDSLTFGYIAGRTAAAEIA